MKYLVGIAGILVVIAGLAGCNTLGRQPQFTQATITPSELKPGDSAIITVDLKDKYDIVHSVEGVVREDPSIKLKLRPESEVSPEPSAAEKPQKGVVKKRKGNQWTLQVDVPFQAPPGDFTLDITAFRADGTPVSVKGPEGKTVPLAVTVPVVIKNP